MRGRGSGPLHLPQVPLCAMKDMQRCGIVCSLFGRDTRVKGCLRLHLPEVSLCAASGAAGAGHPHQGLFDSSCIIIICIISNDMQPQVVELPERDTRMKGSLIRLIVPLYLLHQTIYNRRWWSCRSGTPPSRAATAAAAALAAAAAAVAAAGGAAARIRSWRRCPLLCLSGCLSVCARERRASVHRGAGECGVKFGYNNIIIYIL